MYHSGKKKNHVHNTTHIIHIILYFVEYNHFFFCSGKIGYSEENKNKIKFDCWIGSVISQWGVFCVRGKKKRSYSVLVYFRRRQIFRFSCLLSHILICVVSGTPINRITSGINPSPAGNRRRVASADSIDKWHFGIGFSKKKKKKSRKSVYS